METFANGSGPNETPQPPSIEAHWIALFVPFGSAAAALTLLAFTLGGANASVWPAIAVATFLCGTVAAIPSSVIVRWVSTTRFALVPVRHAALAAAIGIAGGLATACLLVTAFVAWFRCCAVPF
jgi:hypothetical protein